MKKWIFVFVVTVLFFTNISMNVNGFFDDSRDKFEINLLKLENKLYPFQPFGNIFDINLNGSVINVLYEMAEVKFEFGEFVTGPRRKVIEVGFNKNNQRVSEKIYSLFSDLYHWKMVSSMPKEDNLIEEFNYKYDEKGNLIQLESSGGGFYSIIHLFYNSGEFQHVRLINYTYNDKNDILTIDPVYNLGKINSKYTYEYDEKGRKKIILWERFGKIQIKYRYDDAKNGVWMLLEESYTTENMYCKLNDKRQIVEEVFYNTDGKVSQKYDYRYDNFGTIIEKIRSRPNSFKNNELERESENLLIETDTKGNPVRLFKVKRVLNNKTKKYDTVKTLLEYQEYSYDEKGNWIAKKFGVRVYDNSTKKFIDTAKYTIYRTISYK